MPPVDPEEPEDPEAPPVAVFVEWALPPEPELAPWPPDAPADVVLCAVPEPPLPAVVDEPAWELPPLSSAWAAVWPRSQKPPVMSADTRTRFVH